MIPKNHISLLITNHVNELCAPLFNNSEISYFHYAKMYDDGRVSVLVTNPYYHSHFWERKYNEDFFPNYKPGIFFNEPCATKGLEDARNYFNIDHMMMLLSRQADHYEVFGFATHTVNDKIISFYMYNLDSLLKFGDFFKENANRLITEIDNNPLISNGYKPNRIVSDESRLKFDNFSQADYLQIDLTDRQIDCIRNLIKGMTMKKIAKIMNLSPKTIEHYFQIIRKKLNCRSRSELIAKALQIPVIRRALD